MAAHVAGQTAAFLTGQTRLDCRGINGVTSVRPRACRVKCSLSGLDPEKVVPQTNRVLLKLDDVARKSAGGVLLPSSAAKFDKILVGEVVAAGSEVTNVAKGSKVLVSDINAYEVAGLGKGDDKLVFCRDKDLLATVEVNQ
eukprot:TRINITY_DN29743_c0_g1_i1.p1 TRINITY_DN29743_c0_g1~~TRINITY_DN29743_c0_g1_i1.p1  ORF type:complete len:141 (+),score=20.21 TRINITY_DN29743_c0_g1_i1:245-667(+)